MEAGDLFLSAELSPRQACSFLSRYGFRDTRAADRRLQQTANRVRDRRRFARLAPSLLNQIAASTDPDATLLHLERLFEAVPDASNLSAYLLSNPLAVEVLVRVLDASADLTQLLVRHPEHFYWVMGEDRLRPAQASYLFSQAGKCLGVGKVSACLDSLRRLQRRELLRIAVLDLLGISDCVATVRQISQLAETVLQTVHQLLARKNLTNGKGFAVMALGKLGGEELNYSSDIDLLYVCAPGCQMPTMIRFARDYTRALTEFTGEGHLYRVDLRLRPMGRTGQIAYPLDAYRQYYETWADTFDRLALIKCRWVAGDRQLGKRFMESVQSFIYKKYQDLGALEEISWLKRRTDRKLANRGEERRNVKLGIGGIREIEFFVQSFQLVYGGSHPEIRNHNTLNALARLLEGGFVSARDHRALREAYLFFRNVEHRLQLLHGLQTQTLPSDPGDLARLAGHLGYPSEQEGGVSALALFQSHLEEKRRAVREIFESLFERPRRRSARNLILDPRMTRQQALELLNEEGVPSPAAVYAGIGLLKRAPSSPYSPSRVRNLLANLLPSLLTHCRLVKDPGLFFTRLDRFCEALGSRVTLYSELIENPDFASRLFHLFLSGEFLSETLIRYPELLDSVAVVLSERPSAARLRRMIEGSRDSSDSIQNSLRTFKRREEFKIALGDLVSFTAGKSRRQLTALAEICLRQACRRALQGVPQLASHSFALFALGKLGGRELTYHSDLDLLFVYDERGPRVSASQFDRLVRGLRRELESYTSAGRAYKLDFRLRPEGSHSSLASPLSTLREYFGQGRAQPWERLAYVKLRPVMRHHFSPAATSLPPGPRLGPSDVAELRHIGKRKEAEIGREEQTGRHNFKVGRGGLMDIQFVVQLRQLQEGLSEPNTQMALRLLLSRRVIGVQQAKILQRGLAFLMRLESARRLLEAEPVDTLSKDPAENELAARLLGYRDGQELLDDYARITEGVRRVYQEEFSHQ